jgi:exopolyphosphatase/guanosine-5'-triphosphate,3'-diphosphate pyrophosphatase
MKAFKLLIDVYAPVDYIACATAAMREAENKDEILRKVKSETGIDIHLIDGNLEAKIIRSAIISATPDSKSMNLLIDVGGGSTELSLERDNRLIDSKSFNLGTIRLLNKEYDKEIWNEIKNWLNPYKAYFGEINCLGTGGNINKYARLYGEVDMNTLRISAFEIGYESLRKLSVKERAEKYGLRPDRAEVIVPAGKIYLEIMKHIQASSIFVPRLGLVDGLVLGLYEKNIFKSNKKKNKQT